MNEKEKLIKLIQENPELPIVFNCSTDEMDDSYSYMFYENFICDVKTIYKTKDDGVYDHIVDISDYYASMYEAELENLSDEEFDKKIKELVDNTEQYKAILVSCSP